jgi:hypothetical protein
MAALTAERKTPRREGHSRHVDVAASTKCYAGGIAVADSSGDAEPGTTATGKTVLGKFAETVDNSSGSAGDKKVEIEMGIFKWSNSSGDPVGAADIESDCYIEDDQTVSKTDGGSSQSKAGRVVQIDTDGVWVATGMP